MDAQQQKTVVGVVLIILFGAMACCGATIALGGFLGYQEAQKAAAFVGAFDGGSGIVPREDEDATDDTELRERFAAEVLAGVRDAGSEDFAYDAEAYELVGLDGGAHISLGNVFAEYQAQRPSERPDFVARTVRGFFPPDVPSSWEDAKPHLLATVRDRLFVELLPYRSGRDNPVLSRPLTEDLVEVVVFDSEDSMQFLNQSHLESWGREADEVFLVGRQHLAARSKDEWENPAPGVYESPWADNHDVGRALLFETIRRLGVKGDPVLFMPQRDHLLVSGADDAEGLENVGQLLSERLELPRANTGRGWRLTKKGLVPWLPPASAEVLSVLRQEADAKDANEQKEALDAYFKSEGTDVFVGTTLFADDDDGKQRSYAVWTKGADTLMPKADFIVFVDLEQPEADRVVAAAPWEAVLKKVGRMVAADDSYWPRRYRVSTFPDRKTLKAIGTNPMFLRNKE